LGFNENEDLFKLEILKWIQMHHNLQLLYQNQTNFMGPQFLKNTSQHTKQ
jgi:hypothetical protein